MRRWLACPLLPCLLACGDGGHATLAPTGSAASASGAVSALAQNSATASSSVTVPKASARSIAKALARGRELAKEEKWSEAQKAFQEAASGDPENAIAFSELGWAALQAGDMDASVSATNRGLELAKDAKVKASLLYNRGRVEEAKGDKEAARKSYEASLALRANDAVKKRLEGLGGTPPTPMAKAKPAICAKAFGTLRAACDCLVLERGAFGLSMDEEGTCSAVDVDSPTSARSIEPVRVAAGAESVLWLLLDVKGRLRPAAMLEGDVVPKKLLEPLKGDATIASLLFERTSTESGKPVRTTAELFCLLGEREGAPVCPLEIPHAISELKDGKINSDRTLTLSRTVRANGAVEVKKQAGPSDLAPSGALGSHPLFELK